MSAGSNRCDLSTCISRGQFWRERLETVLTRTIPSQHVQLGKHGILNR